MGRPTTNFAPPMLAAFGDAPRFISPPGRVLCEQGVAASRLGRAPRVKLIDARGFCKIRTERSCVMRIDDGGLLPSCPFFRWVGCWARPTQMRMAPFFPPARFSGAGSTTSFACAAFSFCSAAPLAWQDDSLSTTSRSSMASIFARQMGSSPA